MAKQIITITIEGEQYATIMATDVVENAFKVALGETGQIEDWRGSDDDYSTTYRESGEIAKISVSVREP